MANEYWLGGLLNTDLQGNPELVAEEIHTFIQEKLELKSKPNPNPILDFVKLASGTRERQTPRRSPTTPAYTWAEMSARGEYY
jgi:hypothetical protein